jgi:hypothetical protein
MGPADVSSEVRRFDFVWYQKVLSLKESVRSNGLGFVSPEFALNSDGSIGNGVADVGFGLLSRASCRRHDAFDHFSQPLPRSKVTHETTTPSAM